MGSNQQGRPRIGASKDRDIISYPQRPQSHVIGDEAVRLFRAGLPREWIVTELHPDYGLDLHVQIVDGCDVTGEEFLVQVKGTSSKKHANKEHVNVSVGQATVNFWLAKLTPILIVQIDTGTGRCWQNWFEYAYHDYPQFRRDRKKARLILRSKSVSWEDPEYLLAYIRGYYRRMRTESATLFERGTLQTMLFSLVRLHGDCLRIHGTVLKCFDETPEHAGHAIWLILQDMVQFDAALEETWNLYKQQLSEDTQFSSTISDLVLQYEVISGHLTHRKERKEAERTIKGDLFVAPLSTMLIAQSVFPTSLALFHLITLITNYMVQDQALLRNPIIASAWAMTRHWEQVFSSPLESSTLSALSVTLPSI